MESAFNIISDPQNYDEPNYRHEVRLEAAGFAQLIYISLEIMEIIHAF
jgi:hypothetical protein